MRHNLAAVPVIVGLFISLAHAQQPVNPIVLARNVEFTNQTASINTVLFTPKETGTFRISTYLELTQLSPIGIQVYVGLSWQDESLTAQATVVVINAIGSAYSQDNYEAFNTSNPDRNVSASGVLVIRAIAGSSVSLTTNTYPNPYPSGAPPYSMYITVERLSPLPGAQCTSPCPM